MKRSPIVRRTPLQRAGAMRAVSKRQRKRNAEYTAARQQVWDRDGGLCQRCGADGEQVHHRAGRVGDRMADLDLLVLLCGLCHSHIHAHPAESYLTGFMVRRVA